MKSPKLFDLVRHLSIPSHARRDPYSGTLAPVIETLPATFAVYWPSGSPCTAVEMYLLDIANSCTVRPDDGGTLKTKIAQLSHLIRYCWATNTGFASLNDDSFRDFVFSLQQSQGPQGIEASARLGQTNNAIVAECIRFLLWLQSSLECGRVIVGTRNEGAQIRLVESVTVDRTGRQKYTLTYPFKFAPDVPDPKRPMPRNTRNRIWDALADLTNVARLRASRIGDETLRRQKLEDIEYFRARRELTLLLLEATGCRPAELAELAVSGISADGRRIELRTLKRRKKRDPIRSIPIDLTTSIKLDHFLSEFRTTQIMRQGVNRKVRTIPDRVFLSPKTLSGLYPSSLEKEFWRIVRHAGITQRACISMFRHRFITNMVKLHLSEFLESTPGKTRALMTESDYRTILHKVVTFTGHSKEESLLTYFDVAWEELGVFDYVQPAYELSQQVENSVATLTSLIESLKSRDSRSTRSLLVLAIQDLQRLKDRTVKSIDAYIAKSHRHEFSDADAVD